MGERNPLTNRFEEGVGEERRKSASRGSLGARESPVQEVQMWAVWGEPSRGVDAGGASPVPMQMWAGAAMEAGRDVREEMAGWG